MSFYLLLFFLALLPCLLPPSSSPASFSESTSNLCVPCFEISTSSYVVLCFCQSSYRQVPHKCPKRVRMCVNLTLLMYTCMRVCSVFTTRLPSSSSVGGDVRKTPHPLRVIDQFFLSPNIKVLQFFFSTLPFGLK
jgi:hypothetical protein